MHYGRATASSLLCALFVLGGAVAGSDGDPWAGKTGDDVTAVLGLPDKVKEDRNGRALVYKLLVPGETPPLDPAVRLLQCPGVGLVIQVVRREVPETDRLEFEPTQLDEEGRQIEGGYARSSSRSMSYRTETGEVERDWEEGPELGEAKKITLRFELDADGRVRSWSVSPKKYRKFDPGP